MTNVNRAYKDTLFRHLFNSRKELLSLYNAVNQTTYKNEADLEINTLENVIYLKMKNDVSFVFNLYLNLYEHQSTLNRNMPLRNLFYVSDLLQQITKDENIYSDTRITIPTPRFVVFYNGKADIPEQMVLRLSDSFSHKERNPELELKVIVYNINRGMNPKLLDNCHTLKEYMQFVQIFRENLLQYGKETAVRITIDTCIEENILKDFLVKHRSEAIAMCLYEYDEEKHIEMERKEHYARGLSDGISKGISQGKQEEVLHGIRILVNQYRKLNQPESDIIQALMENYGLPEKEAQKYLK